MSYFRLALRNPKKEFLVDENSTHLLHGEKCLTSSIEDRQFSFFPQNYYPEIFEAYKKLNTSLAKMLTNSFIESKTDILVELACANGVLGTLAHQLGYKKFYAIQHSASNAQNSRYNLEQNGLKSERNYFDFNISFTKTMSTLNKVIEQNSTDCRICFVFQNFAHEADEYQRKSKRDILVKVRSIPHVKSILFVTSINTLFKLEQYTHNIMCGERKKENIIGDPFVAVEAKLVDKRPNTASCYAIVRLQRD